ncbi:hypothetical protein BJ742DRAFT_832733 [Cladochytrium replicatum]|nr:hypothetical protein BJ742DRAFT_832733 [Cladochytrium replicatum]
MSKFNFPLKSFSGCLQNGKTLSRTTWNAPVGRSISAVSHQSYIPSLSQHHSQRPTAANSCLAINSLRSFYTSLAPRSSRSVGADGTESLADVTGAQRKRRKGFRNVPAEFGDLLDAPLDQDDGSMVHAYSTAENYDFSRLRPILRTHYTILPALADDVLHIRLKKPSSTSGFSDSKQTAEAFIFNNGTFVTWGASQSENAALLDLLKPSQEGRKYDSPETEWFYFYEAPEENSNATADTIIIGQDLPPQQAKLAFSSGLARSVKLGSLESLLDAYLDKNRLLPELLSSGRRLSWHLRRVQILRNVGELFSLRGHVNLHSELLDSPEFCWVSEKMEHLFEKVCRNLDVKPRIAIVNKKLDYANEFAELLRNYMHEKHGLHLEWMIIVLIMIEVLFEFLHYAEKLGYTDPSQWAFSKKKDSDLREQDASVITSQLSRVAVAP